MPELLFPQRDGNLRSIDFNRSTDCCVRRASVIPGADKRLATEVIVYEPLSIRIGLFRYAVKSVDQQKSEC